MADPTFAELQVARIEALMAAQPGVQSFTIGNTTVAYADLLKQYEYWKRKVALESGAMKRASRINLSNW